VRPGHLGEDPGLLGTVADRLERGERLPIQVQRVGEFSACGGQAREPAKGQARAFPVAESPLDVERLGVAGPRRARVPGDRVQDPVER
jgi:hypothetical protein